MNNTLPSDIEAIMTETAAEFRAAMAEPPMWWQQPPLPDTMTREQYEREAIAAATAARPDNESAEDLD